jgi:hypothetical protein
MPNQSTTKTVLICLAILSAAAALWLFPFSAHETTEPSEQTNPAASEGPSQNTPNSATIAASGLPALPSHETALQTLFNLPTGAQQVKTAEDTLTSFWFEQTLKVGDDIIHALFFKSQQLDESGELIDGHATSVGVGVITYQLQNQQWQVVGKQVNFADAGAYGDVPDTDISSMKLSAKVVAILIGFSDTMGGYTEEGKTLFAYSDHVWSDMGYISTGADNAGACDDEPVANGELGLGACWSYQGTINIQPGQHPDYPDLLVSRSGTDSDDTHTGTRPATNTLYRYDGKHYAEAQ